MSRDWQQRAVAPGRRKRPWRGLTLYDWVAQVTDVGIDGALVYGLLVQCAGSSLECKDVSIPTMAERLQRSESWTKKQLASLEKAGLVWRKPPKGNETCLRWRFRAHPAQPDLQRGRQLEYTSFEVAQKCLALWVASDATAGVRDHEDDVGSYFFYALLRADTGPLLLEAQVRRFLAQPSFELDDFRCALPALARFVESKDWCGLGSEACDEYVGWRAFVKDEENTERLCNAYRRDDPTWPARVNWTWDEMHRRAQIAEFERNREAERAAERERQGLPALGERQGGDR